MFKLKLKKEMEVTMDKHKVIGKSHVRIDGRDKITGKQIYVNDKYSNDMLFAAVKTSPHAHAKILSIDAEKAKEAPGVRGVVTGEDLPYVVGLYLGDKYPLARNKVRHYGEAVVAVIGDSEAEALEALKLIQVKYEQLEPVLSLEDALRDDSVLVHEKLGDYKRISAVHPEPGLMLPIEQKLEKEI